jgi:hypothetical protein
MTQNSRRKVLPYTESQATRWLTWLACGMQGHGQTVFQIEQLQPSWLGRRGELLVYLLGTRIVWGLVSGLISGPTFGAISWLLSGDLSWLVIGLITGPMGGLMGGLISGLIDFWRLGRTSLVSRWGGRSRNLQMILGMALWGLMGGLMGGLIFGPMSRLEGAPRSMPTFGLMYGLIGGLIFGLFWTVRSAWRPLVQAIQPVEMLQWSWRSSLGVARRGLGVGLVVGFISGLTIGIVAGLTGMLRLTGSGLAQGLVAGLVWGLLVGLILGLVTGLMGGLLGGFRPGIRDMKTVANQGIQLSCRYAIQVGATGGTLVGFLALALHPVVGVACGLIFGLGVGMWFGGFEVVEHGILRLILAARGHAPRSYAHFLGYAAQELNFLQQVGGGYMFIHRYLLEYFAGLKAVRRRDPNRPPSSPPVTTATGRN